MPQESDDLYLLTEVASLYYEENYTQEQIAKVIGISRSGVSRLLTRSRELGLVDIHVHHPLRTSTALRDELTRYFGLQDAQVLQNTPARELILSHIGALAARYIDRRIQESQMLVAKEKTIQTIGIAWGTSMWEMLKALRPRRRLPLNVIQLTGSVDPSSSPDIDSPQIAHHLAYAYGAHCYYLHTPLLVVDNLVHDGLLKEKSIRRTFQLMEQMDMALVGIGGVFSEASGLFGTGYLNESEASTIRSQGAVGDICGYYFDLEGQWCAKEMLERTMTVSLDVLRNVSTVVAVAAGMVKVEAIYGALRTGIVKVLITDEPCARAVVQLAKKREAIELSSD